MRTYVKLAVLAIAMALCLAGAREAAAQGTVTFDIDPEITGNTGGTLGTVQGCVRVNVAGAFDGVADHQIDAVVTGDTLAPTGYDAWVTYDNAKVKILDAGTNPLIKLPGATDFTIDEDPGSYMSIDGILNATAAYPVGGPGTASNGAIVRISLDIDGTAGSFLLTFGFTSPTTYWSGSGSHPVSTATGMLAVNRNCPTTTARVSLPNLADQTTLGTQGNDTSSGPVISADGRFVAFSSAASNLVLSDTNGYDDVFVHDTYTGRTVRASVSSGGTQGNSTSWVASISGDGRFVAFQSAASNLVDEDTNNTVDVFVHDRDTDEDSLFDEPEAISTTRVSVPNLADQPTLGEEGDAPSFDPSLSADGRYVAFWSQATNLVLADTNSTDDVFVHDRQTGTTVRVSVHSSGTEGNGQSRDASISGDGRYVAFDSSASNLVDEDTNDWMDVFVHDRQTGATARVSVPNLADQPTLGNEADGGGFDPSISANGRYVAFPSYASNLVLGDTKNCGQPLPLMSCPDVFVHDRQTGATVRVSVRSDGAQGDGPSGSQGYTSAISGDGRHVAFVSEASNLVDGDTNGQTDVFMHDRDRDGDGILDEAGAIGTARVSVDSDGNQADGQSYQWAAMSTDARHVAFFSHASNLVPGDTNGKGDVFVHEWEKESVSAEADAEDTVTTDTEADGATAEDPVETWVTTPNAGTVSIEEAPITETPPLGYHFLGQQVSITAPPASANDPLVIVLRIDSSRVPAGQDESTIQIFRDGVEVPACTGAPGIASPDPCVSNRALLPDGDVEITVLTSTASAWNFGVATAPPVGGIAQLPDAGGSSGVNYAAIAGTAVAAAAAVLAAGGWYARRRRLG